MMEYADLVNIIEDKVNRLINAKSGEEEALKDEIKSILLGDEFIKGPFTDENGEEVCEFIHFDNAGVPERFHYVLYKTKLDNLLKRDKKGNILYKNNKSGRKFADFIVFCIIKMKNIDILACRWSELQKKYMKDMGNQEIQSDIEKLAYQICEKVIGEYKLNLYTDDGGIRDIKESREIELDALNEVLGEALCFKSEKCYDFEKNDSFNAYIKMMLGYKISSINKAENCNNIELDCKGKKTKFTVVNYESITEEISDVIGTVQGVEAEIIDSESGYRVFEALFKVLPLHVTGEAKCREDIINIENGLNKKVSIYQSILSYNIINDIEDKKGVGDIKNNESMDIYLNNEQRIYSIIRKTLVAFLKEGEPEDFYDLYCIIMASIREGISLNQMQKNLQDYFYRNNIASGKGKPISRQTVGKYIEEFKSLVKELGL